MHGGASLGHATRHRFINGSYFWKTEILHLVQNDALPVRVAAKMTWNGAKYIPLYFSAVRRLTGVFGEFTEKGQYSLPLVVW
jgi:hypothetical protein